jgi:hypothetical protein
VSVQNLMTGTAVHDAALKHFGLAVVIDHYFEHRGPGGVGPCSATSPARDSTASATSPPASTPRKYWPE